MTQELQKQTQAYLDQWLAKGGTYGTWINQLHEKMTFAVMQGKTVYAGGDVRSAVELEQMVIFAEDSIIRGDA